MYVAVGNGRWKAGACMPCPVQVGGPYEGQWWEGCVCGVVCV